MEILGSVRSIDASARARAGGETQFDELVPTRVMDIIDETGQDTIVRLQQNGGFMDVCCYFSEFQ